MIDIKCIRDRIINSRVIQQIRIVQSTLIIQNTELGFGVVQYCIFCCFSCTIRTHFVYIIVQKVLIILDL
jgi:hypothetical protein